MTLLEALKQSRAMWLWLYENPGRSKIDYLREIGVEGAKIVNNCFICEYNIRGSYCQGDCPIIWAKEYPNDPYTCELTKSPYYQWTEAESGSEEEHEAAGKIIDLHDQAIERCKKMLMRRLKSRLKYYWGELLMALCVCPVCHERMVTTRTGRRVCLNKINH